MNSSKGGWTVNTLNPQRSAVLIAFHGDGFVEAFAEKHVDIKIVDIPHCPGSEILAEDYFESQLPHRYRQLYCPGKLRAHATHRPLLPSKIRDALAASEICTLLNQAGEAEELCAWTL